MTDKPIIPVPDTQSEQPESCGLSRREFLKMSAATGGAAAILGAVPGFDRLLHAQQSSFAEQGSKYLLTDLENQINTVCLQCNTGCGIKVKLINGIAAKIDGNPYSPWTMHPHLPYETPLASTGTTEGALCPKGQAGLQTAYDPYRIVSVLKRKPGTKRGAGQWITIPFEKAIDEIVNGGDLFGEGKVDGFKDVYALKDEELFKNMGAEVKKIWAAKTSDERATAVADFKKKFADHLDVLIDPDHPDFGPKNNQFAFIWGRMKGGREDIVDRFVKEGFGSINANGHTTICQGSLYYTGKAMSARWNATTGAFDNGDKFYWQGDISKAEFAIFVGANVFEANYGPPVRVPGITQGVTNGDLKYAVIDPRFTKAASKAWKWIPIQPGQDSAFALGMIRWMLDSKRYNAAYLALANQAAATAAKEPNYTNASWLVKLKGDVAGKFLRASEIGLVTKQTNKDKDGKDITIFVTPDGTQFTSDTPVVLVDGKPVTFDPVDPKATPVKGDLLVTTKLGDFDVKSGLQLLAESAAQHTIAEWATIAGIQEKDITDLALEFTSHGRKAVADIHRGPSQHTNGFYTNNAWYVVNLLIGNFDYAGGMVKLTTYDRKGTKPGQPFNIAKMTNGDNPPFGMDMLRSNINFEKTTLFDGKYPAKRPWFPLADGIYQEDVPSIGDAYPYPIKIAMFYMSAITYSLPAAHTVIEILADPKKIPLVITSDILVGETSTYSDYVFPDLSYLERWEFHGSHPSVLYKVENVRQPAIAIPGWPTVKVFGEEIPMSFEAVYLAVAEKLNLPGFGPDGFGKGKPFTRPEDLYLKQVANIAAGEKEDGSDAVSDATEDEIQLFLKARQNLPKSVFDADRWKQSIGGDDKLWRKVIYVLNRGGRYENADKAYKGEQVARPYGRLINLYQEKTATTINSMTGKPFVGYTVYIPLGQSVLDETIEDKGYDFSLITYKEITMAKGRGVADYWLLALMPENFILMNAADAAKLGLKTGDSVKVSSASNPQGVWDLKDGTTKAMIGKVKAVQGIRPGVVAFPLGWGHYASGARDITIDDKTVKGDSRRAAGIHANAAMRVDPVLQNVTLSDLAGGSAVFYDTKVKIEKV
jgi:anaerobic selenocysteine-containing dehydrogenase